MADEDLVVRARIDDELSTPLKGIRDDLDRVGDEATTSGRRAATASRGWATFGKVAKRALLGIAAGAAAAGYATYRVMKSSIAEASSLNESLNAVNVSYGKQAGAVKKLGREAAKSLGLSNVEFNGLAVQFSSFAKAIGGGGKGTVKALDAITTRAADFASVMNIEVAESTALFQSGLAGESEPLRRYGINLSAAAVESYALAKGILESGEKMTDAQKIQATYGLLMAKTANTQGDFTNTSDQLANQQRILGARFDNAKAKLGKGLLPTMTGAVKWLNREGIPAFLDFSDWFNNKGLPAIGRFIDKAKPLAAKYLPKVKDALADVADVAKVAAGAAGDLVGAFLDMPSWARKVLIGGAAGAAISSKLGVNPLRPQSGPLGAVASMARPTPVFVTNMAGGLGGAPGAGAAGGAAGAAATTWGTRAAAAMRSAAMKAGWLTIGITLVDELSNQTGLDAALDGSVLDGNGAGKRWIERNLSGTDPNKTSPVPGIFGKDISVGERGMERVGAKLDAVRAKAAGFGTELDLVGARKVEPRVKADSIQTANDALSTFIGYQIDAGRPVTPYINTTSIERALGQIATLNAAIHAIPTAGVDNGVPFVSGGRPAPTTPNAVTPRVKPPEPTTVTANPRTRTGGGNVTVAPGAVVVNNPASGIDLERAISQGIKTYTREREERG